MGKIAMPLANDFEDSEYRHPYDSLRRAGHDVVIIGAEAGTTVKGKQGDESARIDTTASDVQADSFDAMVIPGGFSPDHLRTDAAMVEFVRDFAQLGRPIAAVCHGPQLLIEAGVVAGKRMTSFPSVRTDLENAGAEWEDREVCIDGGFITSRNPDDLPAFSQAVLDAVAAN